MSDVFPTSCNETDETVVDWVGEEPEICTVCGGVEPCSHNFDEIVWPETSNVPPPQGN